MESQLRTPVLFCIFNRPSTTRQVFEALRKARPDQLFIEADGPRADHPEDSRLCQEARDVVATIDWPCQVHRLYRDKNLGCQPAVVGGINWFFEHVTEGIILEDDCLPSHSFFAYCQEVLERYREETRVVHINGNNYCSTRVMASPYSYHFTFLPQVWGWATWKRAWKKFEPSMALLPQFDDYRYFKHAGINYDDYQKIRARWYKVHSGQMQDNVWDYQWHFINLLSCGLVVSPVKNLVSNLGFAGYATHSPQVNPLKAGLPTFELDTVTHPPEIFIDMELNSYYKEMMMNESFLTKIKRKLRTKGIHIPMLDTIS
jgi:hypothetical protein